MQKQTMVQRLESDADILAGSEVMRQLRPHIKADQYLAIVRRMMNSDGYRQAAVQVDGMVRAVAGYRFMEMLYCGKILYVDDLITDEQTRSRGHGKLLIEWLENEARTNGCDELHLDSGVQREHAHRFYFREGLTINAYHFRKKV
ncbi:MAG TPA: GNAT family N-acetyltransferase [Steroidobacteraceae bacterium]|nr:GNAT family N-acetyltransferase [Steroidobacteraceae bacterium]